MFYWRRRPSRAAKRWLVGHLAGSAAVSAAIPLFQEPSIASGARLAAMVLDIRAE
jgi:hypothetical protein